MARLLPLLLRALLLAATAPTAADAFPLIEASGVDPFAAAGWDMLVSGGHLCGVNASGALLLSSTGARAELLNGPTPQAAPSSRASPGSREPSREDRQEDRPDARRLRRRPPSRRGVE